MTASDGASKYKVVEAPASGKVSCYEIDSSGTENLVSETTESDNSMQTKYYRGSATDTVTVNMNDYGNVTSISGGGNASFGYDNGSASSYAAVLSNVHDNYSGRSYFYDRDHSYNVCGWKISGKFEARQIKANETEYTYNGAKSCQIGVNYDSNCTVSPRISGMYMRIKDGDNLKALRDMQESYAYDAFGRKTNVTSSYHAMQTFVGSSLTVTTDTSGAANTTYNSKNLPIKCVNQINFKETSAHSVGSSLARSAFTHTMEYGYDASGNITSVSEKVRCENESQSGTRHEEWISVPQTTKVSTYSYDKFGRMISEQNEAMDISGRSYMYSGARLASITDSGTTRYMHYDSRGRLSKITSDSAGNSVLNSYSYDNYGNRISDSKRSYTWTRGSLLATAGSTSYTYGYDGIRTKKVHGGKTTEYFSDGGKLLAEATDDNCTYYAYSPDGICGLVTGSGISYKFVKDILGNVLMIKSSERVLARYAYDAHGNCKVLNPDGTENTSSDFIGNINPIRWKGFYYDKETGLYYANGRYYDPEIGRYLDAMDIPTAISEMYLDRTGIMCDNIFELTANAYTVISGLAKMPVEETDDGSSDGGIPWWAWLLFGAGVVLITVVARAAAFGAAGIAIGALTKTAALIGTGGSAAAIATSAGVAVAATGMSIAAVHAGVYVVERWTALFGNIVFSKNADRNKPKDRRNNRVQNKEFRDVINEYNRSSGKSLTQNTIERFHRHITKKGIQGFKNLLRELLEWLGI